MAVLRDDDAHPTPELEKAFEDGGGRVIAWRAGRALEDELFCSLSDEAIRALVTLAIEIKGETAVNEHIKSASDGKLELAACKGALTPGVRIVLGKAANTKKSGWFKTVSAMEMAGRDIVGPDLEKSDAGFRAVIDGVLGWMDKTGE